MESLGHWPLEDTQKKGRCLSCAVSPSPLYLPKVFLSTSIDASGEVSESPHQARYKTEGLRCEVWTV